MKKLLSMILVLSTVLSITSCKYEEDDIWDQSAAERIESLSKSYAQTLKDSKGGWAMEYYPTNTSTEVIGNGYLIMAKFNENNTVATGMKNVFSNNNYISDFSTWEINKDQGPVLSFSSYNNCIHVFADPYDLPFTGNSENEINEEGKGAQGDYEFMMVEVPADGDYVLLKGKKRGTYIRLTPVPEDTDFKTYIEDCQKATADFFPTTNSLEYTIVLPDSIISTYEFASGLSTLYPQGKDRVMTGEVNPYLVTKRNDTYSVRFRDKITLKDDSQIQEFTYNAEEDLFKSVENESCYIDAPELSSYFDSRLGESKSWAMTSANEMSSFYSSLYSSISTEFKSLMNSDLKTISLRKTGNNLTLRLTYGSGIRQQSLSFTIDSYKMEDGKFSIGNVTGDTTDAKTLLSSSNALQSFVSLLKEANTFAPTTTRYNPNTLKLINDNDAEKWVTLTLI
ncbi:MAG: DUF4302 domain-containing protein [Prevotella sp.]|nr:DUF4302 domain-containing protein [Prevotella sp.]